MRARTWAGVQVQRHHERWRLLGRANGGILDVHRLNKIVPKCRQDVEGVGLVGVQHVVCEVDFPPTVAVGVIHDAADDVRLVVDRGLNKAPEKERGRLTGSSSLAKGRASERASLWEISPCSKERMEKGEEQTSQQKYSR